MSWQRSICFFCTPQPPRVGPGATQVRALRERRLRIQLKHRRRRRQAIRGMCCWAIRNAMIVSGVASGSHGEIPVEPADLLGHGRGAAHFLRAFYAARSR